MNDSHTIIFNHIVATLPPNYADQKKLLKAMWNVMGPEHPGRDEVGRMIDMITRTQHALAKCQAALSDEFQKMLKGDTSL